MASQPTNPTEPQKPAGATTAAKPAPQETDAGHVPITEEMDSAKWTLPPVVPIAIGLGVIAVVIAIVAYGFRATPKSAGTIQGIYAVDVPNQNTTLVEVQLNVRNIGEKPMYINGTRIEIQVPGQSDPLKDDGNASPADFERYMQAFPDLRQHAIDPLRPEQKIPVGGSQTGMVFVSFPVTKDVFDKCQSLKAVILIDDQNPLVLKQ